MTSENKEQCDTTTKGTDAPLAIDTRQLFADAREVLLVHDEVVYRLRITKAGKLILTK